MKRTLIATTALMAVVVSGLLLPVPFQSRASSVISDLVHAPLFGALTIGLLALLHRLRPLPNRSLLVRYVIVTLSMTAFGLCMEYAQRISGRSSSTHDAVANTLGIIAAVLIYVVWQQRQDNTKSRWGQRVMILGACILLAIACWHPLNTMRDIVAVRQDFPLLGSFESTAELGRWYFRDCDGALATTDVTHGSKAMAVSYQPTSHPGATLIEFGTDWSQMQTLELDVTLDASYPNDRVTFMVKVIDQLHNDAHADTYRGVWKLKPGQRQHIRITRDQLIDGPDTRALNLSQIKFVDLLLLEPTTTAIVRIDALKLTL